MAYFAWLGDGRKRTCNVLFGWAFENTIVAYVSFPQSLKLWQMPNFAGMGHRKHCKFVALLGWVSKTRQCTLVFPSEFQKGSTAILCSLGWAEPSQTQQIQCFARLNSEKRKQIYLFFLFSALLESVSCTLLSRSSSKWLTVRAPLRSNNFVRLHSRFRRDMRFYT